MAATNISVKYTKPEDIWPALRSIEPLSYCKQCFLNSLTKRQHDSANAMTQIGLCKIDLSIARSTDLALP